MSCNSATLAWQQRRHKIAPAAAAIAHFDFLYADFTIMVVIEGPGKASYISRATHPHP
jgi:hypothetical protein